MKKIYLLSDLKPIPDYLKKRFEDLESKKMIFLSQDEEKTYKEAIDGKIKLETIIVILCELKDKDRFSKKYVRWIRKEKCSVVDEKVNKYLYDKQYQSQMEAEKIAKGKKIEIVAAYEILVGQLRARFLKEYRCRMRNPKNWASKKKLLTKDRFYYHIERIYNMPFPWNHWDYRNFIVQTYFLIQNSHIAFFSGGSGSSGQRENHSRYGFLFARCQNKGINIPTHILAYDNGNRFRYLTSSNSLILSSRDLGSNYHIEWEEQEKLLRDIRLLRINSGLFAHDRPVTIEIYTR